MASMSRWFVGSSRISTTSSPASPGGADLDERLRPSATRLVSPPDSVGDALVEAAAEAEAVEDRGRRPSPDPVTSTDRRAGERRVLVEHHDPRPSAPPDVPASGSTVPGELAQQRRLAATR